MTYETDDASTQDGRLRELYTFTVGGVAYRYTSHDSAVIYASSAYAPIPGLERRQLAVATLESTSDTEIELSRTADIVARLVGGGSLPEFEASVAISRLHLESGEAQGLYDGQITGVTLSGVTAKVQAINDLARLADVPLPRIRAQKLCAYQLYGAGCGLDREAGGGGLYKYATTISAIVSNVKITVAAIHPSHDAEEYAGGEVWIGNAKRTILKVTGTTLRLITPLVVQSGITPSGAGVDVGDAALLYLGCDRSYETCDERFSNTANFGGFPWIGDALRPFRARVV